MIKVAPSQLPPWHSSSQILINCSNHSSHRANIPRWDNRYFQHINELFHLEAFDCRPLIAKPRPIGLGDSFLEIKSINQGEKLAMSLDPWGYWKLNRVKFFACHGVVMRILMQYEWGSGRVHHIPTAKYILGAIMLMHGPHITSNLCWVGNM